MAATFLIFSPLAYADSLKSPVEARQLIDRVMTLLAAGDVEGGLRLAKPYLVIPEAEFEAMLGQAKMQMPLMSQRFGKSIGRELLREDKAGESFLRLVYIHKFEKHAARWTFIFYRPDEGWVLNSFHFDDNVRALFY
jgi:hypothetical protein